LLKLNEFTHLQLLCVVFYQMNCVCVCVCVWYSDVDWTFGRTIIW
jgi:hypothetical protein